MSGNGMAFRGGSFTRVLYFVDCKFFHLVELVGVYLQYLGRSGNNFPL